MPSGAPSLAPGQGQGIGEDGSHAPLPETGSYPTFRPGSSDGQGPPGGGYQAYNPAAGGGGGGQRWPSGGSVPGQQAPLARAGGSDDSDSFYR